MKTLFKLQLVLFALLLVLIGLGIVILTRPGVQKKILEGQLPEGSSIHTVRVTTGTLELSELKLALPDGTEVRVKSLETEFKPLAALFDKTVKLGALTVDGLVVKTPQTLLQDAESVAAAKVPGGATAPEALDRPAVAPAPSEVTAAGAGSPMDALYALGRIGWLFDIDSIRLEGELRDGGGSSYAIDLKSGAIRPGEASTIEASLQLRAEAALYADLKYFDANAKVLLKQNLDGGFEELRFESFTKASDRSGNPLLALSQQLDLTIESFGEKALVKVEFNADLPRPEVFLPEMAGVGAVNVQGRLAVGAEGEALTLSEAELLLSTNGRELVFVDLKKAFTLGGTRELSGDLIDIRITDFPLALLRPWMPEDIQLSGDDFSARFNVTGLPEGAMRLSAIEPLRLGPLTLRRDGALFLDQVTVLAQPVVRLAADQSIEWDLGGFQIQDRYGAILDAQSRGSFRASSSDTGGSLFPSGLETDTRLDLGLQEITQQPALADYASILSGRATIDLKLMPTQEIPLQVQGRIDAISPRALPGQRQDYRFAIQFSEPRPGSVALAASFQAGSESNPSSGLQIVSQASPETSPLEFKVDLEANRISQLDLQLLSAAFQPEAQPVPARTSPVPETSPPPTRGGTDSPPDTALDTTPAWAGYQGEVNLSVAEFYLLSGEVLTDLKLAALVSEPLLSLKQLQAFLKGGKISGRGDIRYSENQQLGYAMQADLNFENFNPAVFSEDGPGSFPVRGTFDGRAQLAGRGENLESALDAIEGEILVTGREGVLTAFELDNRSNLGLLGAGILGSQLNRPGISAMAQAVPYFQNMPFSDFSLKLTRGPDRRIMIPELRFVGRNVLIDGAGSIAGSSLKDALSQPLDLTLELGAKGRLVDSLETLGLLGPATSEDGFRRWNKSVEISGSLDDPNTSALQRLLKDAAYRAIRDPEKDRAPAETGAEVEATQEQSPLEQNLQPEPSKEEKIIRDVETGLNILNSLLNQ